MGVEEEKQEEEEVRECDGAKQEVWLLKEQSADGSCSEIDSLPWFLLLFPASSLLYDWSDEAVSI